MRSLSGGARVGFKKLGLKACDANISMAVVTTACLTPPSAFGSVPVVFGYAPCWKWKGGHGLLFVMPSDCIGPYIKPKRGLESRASSVRRAHPADLATVALQIGKLARRRVSRRWTHWGQVTSTLFPSRGVHKHPVQATG